MLATITAAGTQDPIHETRHCVCYLDIKNCILVSRGSALHRTVSWNRSMCGQLNIYVRQGIVAAHMPVHRCLALQTSQRFRRARTEYSQRTNLLQMFGLLFPTVDSDAALPTVIYALDTLSRPHWGTPWLSIRGHRFRS